MEDVFIQLKKLGVIEDTEKVITHNFSYRAYPTKEQKEVIDKGFDFTRGYWNRLVQDLYDFLKKRNFTGGKIPEKELVLTSFKKLKEENPYFKSAESTSMNEVLQNMRNAIKAYNQVNFNAEKPIYKKRSLKKKKKDDNYVLTFKDLKKMPCFHSKFKCKDSFTVRHIQHSNRETESINEGNVHISEPKGRFCYAKIPKLKTEIKFRYHRELPQDGVILQANLEKVREDFYKITFCVAYSAIVPTIKSDEESTAKVKKFLAENKDLCLGIDYNQENGGVTSNRKEQEVACDAFNKPYKQKSKKLARFQRIASKRNGPKNEKNENGENTRIPPSKNWFKNNLKVKKLHSKTAAIRKYGLDNLSKKWADEYLLVGVEDIDLNNMSRGGGKGKRKKSFAKRLLDNGFGEFRRMLEYKLSEQGKIFSKVGRFFPSSQICNNCGHKNEQMKDINHNKNLVCSNCGHTINRDVNASLNIRDEAINAWRLAVKKKKK